MRHTLGAFYLEVGSTDPTYYAKASETYEEDLGMRFDPEGPQKVHPNCIWSLVGLAKSYKLQEQQEKLEGIQEALNDAKSKADRNIETSCFCSRCENSDSSACRSEVH